MTIDTTNEFNELLKTMRDCLAEILVDDLGIYEILSGTQVVGQVPSIRVGNSTNNKNTRFKANSGIECVISFPEIKSKPQLGSKFKELKYCLVLVQYDTTKSTSVAVNKILGEDSFQVISTTHSPYQYFGNEYRYEQCRVDCNLFFRVQ